MEEESKKAPVVPKTLEEALLIIAEQDQMIGELTRKVNFLEDTESRRKDWLRKAKEDAGYDPNTSFDVVWKETLQKAESI